MSVHLPRRSKVFYGVDLWPVLTFLPPETKKTLAGKNLGARGLSGVLPVCGQLHNVHQRRWWHASLLSLSHCQLAVSGECCGCLWAHHL